MRRGESVGVVVGDAGVRVLGAEVLAKDDCPFVEHAARPVEDDGLGVQRDGAVVEDSRCIVQDSSCVVEDSSCLGADSRFGRIDSDSAENDAGPAATPAITVLDSSADSCFSSGRGARGVNDAAPASG